MSVNELFMDSTAGMVCCCVDYFLFLPFDGADDHLVVFGGSFFLFELVYVVVDLLIR